MLYTKGRKVGVFFLFFLLCARKKVSITKGVYFIMIVYWREISGMPIVTSTNFFFFSDCMPKNSHMYIVSKSMRCIIYIVEYVLGQKEEHTKVFKKSKSASLAINLICHYY